MTNGKSEAPHFAVVGRVNKGKSSIVATLAEDESVRIDPRPGTTTELREYPVRVDGRTLFVLVDTPGFEDAPRALAWLRSREVGAVERAARVREFVAAHEGTDEFIEERKLLVPVLEGASILYVVDGTHPYRPNYEAEMEILRWTGRPGMALVNRIGEGDYTAEWHRALDQYFRIVRDFDAFSVTFEERLALLRAFRELRPEWHSSVDEATAALSGQRLRRQAEAAGVLADLLADALTHVEESTAQDQEALKAQSDRLERSFHDALRALENQARRRIERLYGYSEGFEHIALARPILNQDLFAKETWRLLGLSPAKLVGAGIATGVTIGGTIDALTGGADFGAGMALGGLIGGGSAAYSVVRRFASVRAVSRGKIPRFALDMGRFVSGVRRFRIGPHRGANFPWVLLDRALLHFDAVARRTHARRGTLQLKDDSPRAGLIANLARQERRQLELLFRDIRKTSDPPRKLRDSLERAIADMLRLIDSELGREPAERVAEELPSSS